MLIPGKRARGGPSIISALLLLLAATYFGGNRDFGAFLLGILVLPALCLAFLVCSGIEIARKGDATRVAIAAMIALISPLAFYASAHLRDHLAFYTWAITHSGQLDKAMQNDGIVTGWASWGIAGSDNDSYLVADRADSIGSLDAAERWRKRHGLSCEIVASKRVWPRLYLVTTYNCSFDEAPLPID